MSALLPSAQAREIRDGLLDYLITTFALADPDARLALTDFLGDREHGIFKGPFLRLRLPFLAAADGWQSILGWDIGLAPYGDQAEGVRRSAQRNSARTSRALCRRWSRRASVPARPKRSCTGSSTTSFARAAWVEQE